MRCDPRPATITVLLVDDSPRVLEGLRALLDADDLAIVGEAADGDEAVALALATRPDVVVMDVGLPGMNGIEATRRIVASLPRVRVIGFSMHGTDEMAGAMREAGAWTFVPKSGPVAALLQAVRGMDAS